MPAAVCHDPGSEFKDWAPLVTPGPLRCQQTVYPWPATTDSVRLSHWVPPRIQRTSSFTLKLIGQLCISKHLKQETTKTEVDIPLFLRLQSAVNCESPRIKTECTHALTSTLHHTLGSCKNTNKTVTFAPG